MNRRQSGSTIVELMIATVVFSVLLLVLAGGIVQIGRMYMKGLNASRTQQVARQTIDTLSQSIQFTGGNVMAVNPADDGTRGYCIGTKVYSYRLGQQRKENSNALVVRDTGSSCVGATADRLTSGSLPTGANELLTENMRLANLKVTEILEAGKGSGRFDILVRVVYGDFDLLCDDATVDCANNTNTFVEEADVVGSPNLGALACKNIRTGGQFCAMSELTTTVGKRL